VQGWHARWFRPDNCVIAAVGDFSDEALLKQIEAEFGGWQKPEEPLKLPQLKFTPAEGRSGEQAFHFASYNAQEIKPDVKRILVDHPDKEQVMVRLTCLGITRDNPDYIPLVVMDNILGTSPGFTDRFSSTLRDKMGLAYSTYANIARSADVFPGFFLGYIGTRPENVERALQEMYRLVEQIRTQPVSTEELRSAKDYLKGSFVFGLETTGQLASLMINIERFNLGWDWLVKYTQAVEAVTAEDIMRVAQKHLVPGRMVEVLAGPIQKITPAPVEEPAEGEEK
jgi:zinc protease